MLPVRGPGKNQNYNGYRKQDNTPLANPGFDWGVHDQKMIDVDMCEWVEARMEEKQDKPLFLAAGIYNPHLPFYADAATFERYPKSKVKLPPMPDYQAGQNTTIGVIATDAALSKVHTLKIAQMAHDGMARAIRPAHTMFEGDTIFCISTGEKNLPKTSGSYMDPHALHLSELGHAAANCLSRAIIHGVISARSMAGMTAFDDLEDL